MDFANVYLYSAVKTTHIIFAVISITGFSFRAVLKIVKPDILQKRWLKVSPHIIDTVLLISAITLALISHQYPFQNNWLTAKIMALFIYIGLGIVFMRTEKTKMQQILTLAITLLVATYIFSVAITKNILIF